MVERREIILHRDDHEGARHRAVAVGSWERKITWMLARYGEAIATAKARGTGEAARAVA